MARVRLTAEQKIAAVDEKIEEKKAALTIEDVIEKAKKFGMSPKAITEK